MAKYIELAFPAFSELIASEQSQMPHSFHTPIHQQTVKSI